MRKVTLTLTVLLFAAASQAAVITYEDFNYPAGSDLTAQSGGIWSAIGTKKTDNAMPVTAGLAFGGIETSGNAATLTGRSFGAARNSGVTTDFRQGSTYYASAIFKFDLGIRGDWGNGGTLLGVGLSPEPGIDNHRGLIFGLIANVTKGSGVIPFVAIDRLGTDASDITGAAPTGAVGTSALKENQTYLLVAKWVVTDSAARKADVFLNVYDTAAGVPSVESYAIAQRDAVFVNELVYGGALDNLCIFKYNTPGSATVDAICYGTTWNDVVAPRKAAVTPGAAFTSKKTQKTVVAPKADVAPKPQILGIIATAGLGFLFLRRVRA